VSIFERRGLPRNSLKRAAFIAQRRTEPMYEPGKTGLEFIEGFSLLAIALWIGGAAIVLTLVMLGHGRI
jgi:hypothetical protein